VLPGCIVTANISPSGVQWANFEISVGLFSWLNPSLGIHIETYSTETLINY